VTETTEHDDARRGLIDELQSLSATLGPSADDAPRYADIPVLQDVVELPRTSGQPDGTAAAALSPGITPAAALEIEADAIVEDLMDEFLPQLEARLRERLEERMRELVAGRSGADTAR